MSPRQLMWWISLLGRAVPCVVPLVSDLVLVVVRVLVPLVLVRVNRTRCNRACPLLCRPWCLGS